MSVKTHIVKADDPDAAEAAARVLQGGGVIIYPTETLYGIGGFARNRETAKRVSALKMRPPDKPLSVLVRDVETLKRHFIITQKQADAYEKILPLPVTLVLETREPDAFAPDTVRDGRTAVRVSSGEFAARLFKRTDEPVISTSANISGAPAVADGAEAEAVFGGEVELIVDSGNLPPSEGSAIVEFADGRPQILRGGDLKSGQLNEFLRWLS